MEVGALWHPPVWVVSACPEMDMIRVPTKSMLLANVAAAAGGLWVVLGGETA